MKKLIVLLMLLCCVGFVSAATLDVDDDSNDILDAEFGGTNADMSAETGFVFVTAGVFSALDFLKDIVTTAPITGGANDVLPGADADLTIALTLLRDIVTTAPLTGAVDDALPGADGDVTLAITMLKDIVTTSPLTGAEDNVLPGADGDLTLAVTVAKDIVATAPITVNAGANLDNVIVGTDADITIAMPAATNAANGYATSTHITALETVDTENEIEAMIFDGDSETFGADMDMGNFDLDSCDRLEFFDAGLFVDGGTDGVMLISTTDGTLQIETADWDISTTGTITNAEWQGTAIADGYIGADAVDTAEIATDAVTMDGIDADGNFTDLTGNWTTTGTITGGAIVAGASADPMLTFTDSTHSSDGFIALDSVDADDTVLTLGVDDSGGDDQPYIELDGENERIEMKEDVVFEVTTTLLSSNADPTAAGMIQHDSTVAGLATGALVWYDGDEIRYLVDVETLPSDDDYVVAYDAPNDNWYMKVDANDGGNTAWDDFEDPDAASSNTFADGETITFLSSSDDEIFLNIQDDDEALAGVTTLIDLDWSAATYDGTSDAIYINMQDYTTTAYTFSGAAFSSYRPITNYEANAAGSGIDIYTASQTLQAMDGAGEYVRGFYGIWSNADHSAGNVHGAEMNLDAGDAEATEIAYKVTGDWDTAFDGGDKDVDNIGDIAVDTITSDGGSTIVMNDDVHLGADDAIESLVIHDAGTITIYDDSDDTEIVLSVGDGESILSLDSDFATAEDIVIGDSKYIGSASDKLAIQIEADGDVVLTDDLYVDDVALADGAVVGIPSNEIITFNAAGTIVASGATFSATGGMLALTPVTDDADNFAGNFTGANLYGGTFVANGEGDIDIPAPVAGMHFTIITFGDIAVDILPTAGDDLILDGEQLDANHDASNADTAGDIAVVQYYDADGWLVTTNGWTEVAD